ncbi:uncharacterized protein EMH_0079300 [Eimeria mitis]|uniref:Uncharacterized protein n=1 Tax=Eimeria mitis TaxID=44415 RepID=U6K862_9EIME|nr:uncharacterized protein EMH_0079300 [Eimeria mitis]CDJ33011.1 hypothetical protein EMH_0079300 [Eimeria mitis]
MENSSTHSSSNSAAAAAANPWLADVLWRRWVLYSAAALARRKGCLGLGGPLFSCRASEEKGVFGFGGSQVVIWDIGDTDHIVKAFSL